MAGAVRFGGVGLGGRGAGRVLGEGGADGGIVVEGVAGIVGSGGVLGCWRGGGRDGWGGTVVVGDTAGVCGTPSPGGVWARVTASLGSGAS